MLYYCLSKVVLHHPSMLATLEDANEGRLNNLGPKVQVRPIHKIDFSENLVEFVNDYSSEVSQFSDVVYDNQAYQELFYKQIFQKCKFEFNYVNGNALWKLFVVSKLNKIIIVANPAFIDHVLLIQIHKELAVLFNHYESAISDMTTTTIISSDPESSNGKTVESAGMLSIKEFEMKPEFINFKKDFFEIKKNLSNYPTTYFDFQLSKSIKFKLKPIKLLNNPQKIISNYEIDLFKKQYTDILYRKNKTIKKKFKLSELDFYAAPTINTTSSNVPDYDFRLVNLDLTTAAELTKSCKRHGVTINTVVIILYWIAVNRVHGNTEKFIKIEHSIDLRSYLPSVPSYTLAKLKDSNTTVQASGRGALLDGNYTQMVKILIEPLQEDDLSWPLLQQYQVYFDLILGNISKILQNIETLNYLVPPENLVEHKLETINRKDCFLTFSNAGLASLATQLHQKQLLQHQYSQSWSGGTGTDGFALSDELMMMTPGTKTGLGLAREFNINRYDISEMDYSMHSNLLYGANVISLVSTKSQGINFSVGSCDALVVSKFEDVVDAFKKFLVQLAID